MMPRLGQSGRRVCTGYEGEYTKLGKVEKEKVSDETSLTLSASWNAVTLSVI